MKEMTGWGGPPPLKPSTDIGLKKLINEVQEDQWNGATNIERATAARAELFSRLRFPVSSRGTAIKKPM